MSGKKQKRGKPEEYEVEKILGIRKVYKGQREYLLKWKGYPVSESTWENSKFCKCDKLIYQFHKTKHTQNPMKMNVKWKKKIYLCKKNIQMSENLHEHKNKLRKMNKMKYKLSDSVQSISSSEEVINLYDKGKGESKEDETWSISNVSGILDHDSLTEGTESEEGVGWARGKSVAKKIVKKGILKIRTPGTKMKGKKGLVNAYETRGTDWGNPIQID